MSFFGELFVNELFVNDKRRIFDDLTFDQHWTKNLEGISIHPSIMTEILTSFDQGISIFKVQTEYSTLLTAG